MLAFMDAETGSLFSRWSVELHPVEIHEASLPRVLEYGDDVFSRVHRGHRVGFQLNPLIPATRRLDTNRCEESAIWLTPAELDLPSDSTRRNADGESSNVLERDGLELGRMAVVDAAEELVAAGSASRKDLATNWL